MNLLRMSRLIKQRRSPIHGNGVFAIADIPAQTELIEYRGRLLTHAQADRLYDGTSSSGGNAGGGSAGGGAAASGGGAAATGPVALS